MAGDSVLRPGIARCDDEMGDDRMDSDEMGGKLTADRDGKQKGMVRDGKNPTPVVWPVPTFLLVFLYRASFPSELIPSPRVCTILHT